MIARGPAPGGADGVIHGGLSDREATALGLDPTRIVDLSANLHPAGPHPAVIAAAREAEVGRYPDPRAEPLRSEIAAHLDLAPEQVLVTAGSTDALHLAARALLAPGDRCAIFPPTFGEYEAAALHAGARLQRLPTAPPDFRPDLRVPAGTPDDPLAVAFLCNPNNPTGVTLPAEAVAALASALEGGVLVLDAAYEALGTEAADANALVRAGQRVLAVHSLTKQHAIPGLRVGYAVGAPGLIRRLERLQPAWPVGAPALAAARAALRVEAEQAARLRDMQAVRERLRTYFLDHPHGHELAVAPSRANFLLVRVGDAPTFRAALLGRGFAVRDTTSFGLPDWVRLAVPPTELLPRLLEALEATFAALPLSPTEDRATEDPSTEVRR